MKRSTIRSVVVLALPALAFTAALIAAAGCNRTPPDETPSRTAEPPPITDRDWELVAIGERVDPRGAGGRPVTLRLDPTTSRAAGFAGCNRYSAAYVLRADSLTFGPGISTRMACPEGMELEDSYLASLASFTTFEATDSTLVLHGSAGPLARFRRAEP